LVPLLLTKGYRVTVFDLFNFGTESLLQCTFSPDLTLVKGDICDEPALKEVLRDADVIVHLAGIVGYPACSQNPILANAVNVTGTENVVKNVRKGEQKLVFASTGSCYGAIPDGFCTEETPLSPLSLYGSSKAEGEKLVKQVDGVILRLATIFGVSQRLRLDLLINDLVHKAITEKQFDIYEAHFKRTFLHVRDVARAFVFAIENYDTMQGEVYNVGGDNLNYTKMDICNIIKEMVTDCVITPSTDGTDADKRDYQVSYEKIRKLGFVPEIDVRQGIAELKKILPHLSPEYIKKTKNV
jgi:nucleoside-diphosphate-sugar epimerase